MLVRDLDAHMKESGKLIVAVDAVGAGPGEVVLYASGSSARQTQVTQNRPVDHVIMAVVDTVTGGDSVIYDKQQDS
tara:strand:- start:252 stop:479 length:228 start_codon:yes stop_codon:yes gene_type:complete